jgi:hypothetical protein
MLLDPSPLNFDYINLGILNRRGEVGLAGQTYKCVYTCLRVIIQNYYTCSHDHKYMLLDARIM